MEVLHGNELSDLFGPKDEEEASFMEVKTALSENSQYPTHLTRSWLTGIQVVSESHGWFTWYDLTVGFTVAFGGGANT